MARSVRAYSKGISTKDIDYKFSSRYNLEICTYTYFTIPIQCHFRIYFFIFCKRYWVDQENLVDNQIFLVAKIIFGYALYVVNMKQSHVLKVQKYLESQNIFWVVKMILDEAHKSFYL